MDPTPKYEPSRKGVFWLDLKSCGETGDSLLRKSFVMHQANPAAKMTFLIDTPLSPGLGVHVPRGPHTSKHSSWLPALVDCVPCVFALGSERKRQAHTQSALESMKRRPAGRPPSLCAGLYTPTPSRIVVVGRQVLTLVVVVVVGSSLSSSSSTVVGSSLSSSSSSSTSSSSDPVHPETARACAICIARCRLDAAVCKPTKCAHS